MRAEGKYRHHAEEANCIVRENSRPLLETEFWIEHEDTEDE
jgi:hypothetical protein